MTLEKDIEGKLVKIVQHHGGLCLKWVCPGWAGVPDRICLLPGGRIIFVETKRPSGGHIGKLQEYWAGRLKALGFAHMYINNGSGLLALQQAIEAKEETL